LVRLVKDGQRKTSIDTLDSGSEQIAVKEGCDAATALPSMCHCEFQYNFFFMYVFEAFSTVSFFEAIQALPYAALALAQCTTLLFLHLSPHLWRIH
jgi:hypothetical protein